MIIIEGPRRVGKTYTVNTILEAHPDFVYYKDKGMRDIRERVEPVDPDDYAIGRDMAYAQFLPHLPYKILDRLVLDRQYWSSYVYGLFYRKKYSKEFWVQHIEEVENKLFGDPVEEDNLRKHINIILIHPSEEDFTRMADMGRQKDWLEDDEIDGYKTQWDLYMELVNISAANVIPLRAFQPKEEILEVVNKILREENEWHS